MNEEDKREIRNLIDAVESDTVTSSERMRLAELLRKMLIFDETQ